MPEETVLAGMDIKANMILPVHWGKFSLSLHPWNEPIERFTKRAGEMRVNTTTPMIGEPIILGQSYPAAKWWREVNNY